MLAPLEHCFHVSSSLFFCGGLFLKSPLSCLLLILTPPAFQIPPTAHPTGQSSQKPLTILDVLVPIINFGLDLFPLWGPSGRACSSSWLPHHLAWLKAGYQVTSGGKLNWEETTWGQASPFVQWEITPTHLEAGRGGRVKGPAAAAADPSLQLQARPPWDTPDAHLGLPGPPSALGLRDTRLYHRRVCFPFCVVFFFTP